MNAVTVTGYAWDCDIYCPDCIDAVVAASPPEVVGRHWDGEPHPVFAGNETDGEQHCRACGAAVHTSVITTTKE